MKKEEFQAFLNKGDIVRIISNGESTVGEVLSMLDTVVQLRKLENGKTKLVSYEKIEDVDFDIEESGHETGGTAASEPVILSSQSIEEPVIPWENSREDVKRSLKAEKRIGEKWSRIDSSYNYARKNHCLDEKIQSIIKEMKSLIERYPRCSALKVYLGDIYFELEDYLQAFEYYRLGDAYRNAVASAQRGDLGGDRVMAAVSEYLTQSHSDPDTELLKLFFSLAVKSKDETAVADVLARIPAHKREQAGELFEWGYRILIEQYGINSTAGQQIRRIQTTTEAESGSEDRKVPQQMEEEPDFQESAQESAHESAQKSAKKSAQRGKVTFYKEEDRYGFINNSTYFYITQVEDETLREKLARDGLWKKITVSYTLGQGKRGVSADHIRPLEPVEAVEGLKKRTDIHQGFLDEYNRFEGWGLVNDGNGVTYRFQDAAVMDPYLVIYLDEVYPIENIDLLFTLKLYNGKDVVKAVYLPERQRSDRFSAYKDRITMPQEKRWESFLEEEKRRGVTVKAVPQYISLPELPELPELSGFPELPNETGQPDEAESSKTVLPEIDTRIYPEFAGPNPFLSLEKVNKASVSDPCNRGIDCLLKQKNPVKAEQYFIEALKIRDNEYTAVTNLVGIYMRKQSDAYKGIQLLDAYKYLIEEEKWANLRIQLWDKGNYTEYLIEELRRAIPGTFKANTRLHYILQLARVLEQAGEVKDAIVQYREWMRVKQNNESQLGIWHGSDGKYSATEYHVEQHLAIGYYKVGELENAKSIAAKLLRLKAEDPIALSIMREDLDAQLIEQGSGAFMNTDESMIFGEKEALTPYARYRVEKVQLSTIAKGKIAERIDHNNYAGSPVEAKKDINLCRDRYLHNPTPQFKSEVWAVMAKIVIQVRRSGAKDEQLEKNALTDRAVLKYAGRSMQAAGDYTLLQQQGEDDTARFYYHESLDMLSDIQEDVTEPFSRLFATYFLAYDELADLVKAQTNKPGYLEYVKEKKCRSIRELIISTFSVPSSSGGKVRDLMERIYENESMRKSGLLLFGEIHKGNQEKCGNKRDYIRYWGSCKKDYKRFVREFSKELTEAAKESLKKERLDGSIQKIQDRLSQGFLFKTDETRVDAYMRDVLKRLQQLPMKNSYEQKEEDYRFVIEKCNQLSEQIYISPTKLSFEVLLEAVGISKAVAVEGINELYGRSVPSLKVNLLEKTAFIQTGRRQVNVSIQIKNEENMQAADGAKVLVKGLTEGISITTVSSPILSIRGGRAEEQVCECTLSDQVMEQGFFDIRVEVRYLYNKTMEEEVEGYVQQEINVPLSASTHFKKIRNDYAPLVETNGVPLESKLFYGRDEDIQRLVSMLCLEDGTMLKRRGIVMYGQKRAGKTSIMMHLEKQIEKTYGKGTYLIVKINSVGECKDFNGFLSTLLYRLEDVIMDDYPELGDMLAEQGVLFPYEEIEQNPESGQSVFNRAMSRITKALQSLGGSNRYIPMFLIDEFTYFYEWIKSGRLDRDFMKFWKAFLENYNICTVIIGMDNMPNFVSEFPNEFACMTQFPVSFLNEKYTKRLVYDPVLLENGKSRYDEDALDYIYVLTAGNAYLTVILCNALINYLNDNCKIYVSRTVVDIFLEEKLLGKTPVLNAMHFDPQINDPSKFGDDAETLADDNKILLTYLAEHCDSSREMPVAQIHCEEQLSDPSQEHQQQVLQQLLKRDVITLRAEKYCRIKIDLLRKWLLREAGREINNEER